MKTKVKNTATSVLSIFFSPFGWPITLTLATLFAFVAITNWANAQGDLTPASVGNVAGAAGLSDTYRHTVILGVDPGRSYVRIANMSTAPVTSTIEVYGLETESTLGSFQIQVPAKASVQIKAETMIQSLLPLELDQFLALYVRNGHPDQLWQHVQYDENNGEFSNAGICTFSPDPDFLPPGNVALNVHTTRIAQYASFVTVHNFSDTTGIFEVRVYNASTGALKGTTEIELSPRASLNESSDWFQGAVGWFFPNETELHMNIEFVPVDPASAARITVGHVVADLFQGGMTNLSNPCPLHGDGFTRSM